MLSKIVLSLALCAASMTAAVSTNEIIKFEIQLSDLVSTVLELKKKRSVSATDYNVLTSKINDFSTSLQELISELRSDPGKHYRLIHILEYELSKLIDAMEAGNTKKVKKISEHIIVQLNTTINDEQSPYSISAANKKPSSAVFIPILVAGALLGCILSKDELYNCCCTLGKVFTGLAGYAAVVVAFDL